MTVVSVVVPVYYNAATLPELLRRLRAVADRLNTLDFEFIFVDDRSGDGSFGMLSEHSERDARVRAVRLSRNFGSNVAILAGLTYARGDAVAVIAADLQDPPELIPELVEAWQAGAEVVLAARRSRDDPWLTRLFAAIFNRLFRKFVFPDYPPNGFDFMLISGRVAGILTSIAERNSYIFGQVMWVGFTRHVVYYDRARREHDASRWTLRKKAKYFIDAFTAFSYLPVRAASVLGFLLAGLGFAYAMLIIALRLFDIIQEPGFSALMVVVLVAAGSQLVVTGMIGEYLWRVLEESRRRPVFIIDAAINVDTPATTVSEPLPANARLGTRN